MQGRIFLHARARFPACKDACAANIDRLTRQFKRTASSTMRVLITIPHYFQSARQTGQSRARHASQSGDAESRVQALTSSILSLHQLFGAEQSILQIAERLTKPANQPSRAEVHIVLCTVADEHLLKQLPVDRSLYHHYVSDLEPMMLGFQCHSVLRDRWGNYDYYGYGYLEDDLTLHDPWLFAKLAWFNHWVGQDKVLQPNRFERRSVPRDQKVYIDGDLVSGATSRFQNVQDKPQLGSQVMGVPVVFRRTLNPHSGCFFLNAHQLQHWINQPHFLDRDTSFVGPLESAATLGVMRTFKIYKPVPENANFLEIEHLGRGFSRLIRYVNEAP